MESGMVKEPEVVYGTSPGKKRQGEYTLEDYYALPDDVRVELINGVFYYMEAPSVAHQAISMEISNTLYNFVKRNKGTCRVFAAPFDVKLFDDKDDMMEPDVLVICNGEKLRDGKRCNGAPDLVVEILSPSTRKKDMGLKRRKYEDAGVREYWVVDPDKRTVLTYLFGEEDQMDAAIYGFDARIPVGIFGGACEVDLDGVE